MKFHSYAQHVAYVVGARGTILRSTNSGVDWTQLNSGTNRNLRGLGFINFGGAYAVGDSGTILETTNGGDSWFPLTSGTTKNLLSVVSMDLFDAVVVGEHGTILQTVTAGGTWTVRTFDTTKTFNRITLSGAGGSGGKLWIVGSAGSLFSSSNGTTWIPHGGSTSEQLNDIAFVGANRGIVGGDHGVIRVTTDGGATWFSNGFLDSLTTNNIMSIAAIDSNTAMGVAGNAIVGSSTEPVLEVPAIGTEPPSEVTLYQNYPNPFNPSTTIRYNIPVASHVRIKVFNLLGEEVAQLADEVVPPGIQSVIWNGSGVAGGLYFCRLTAGAFTATNKLLLVK